MKKQGGTNGGADLNKQSDSQGFQPVLRKPFRGLVVGNPKKVGVGNPKQVFVPKKNTKEVSTTKTSKSFEALNKLDSKMDRKAFSSEKVVNQKEDQRSKVETTSSTDGGKSKVSLYKSWKEAYGPNVANPYTDDADEILDLVAGDTVAFMSVDGSQGRGSNSVVMVFV